MTPAPRRPFVPQPLPAERPAPGSAAEFRIARPYVPGEARSSTVPSPNVAQSETVASIADFLARESSARAPDFLRAESPAPIANFLAAEAAAPIPEFRAAESPVPISDFLRGESPFEIAGQDVENDSYEFPPIEHFVETIPAEETFSSEGARERMTDPFASTTPETESDAYDWEETDWQRYDWRSAAALGDTTDPEASSAWAQTDWGSAGGPPKEGRESAAKAIADALDGIARRIRDGELVIPPPPAMTPDPATIAATLAALLGVRR